MIMLKRLTTDSCRCSDCLSSVLVTVLLALFPLQALAQQTAWGLPKYKETLNVVSITGGSTFSRDTYLSASRYGGWAVGLEDDIWTGYKPYRFFKYGRSYTSAFFSPMKNRLKGGSTLEAGIAENQAFLWPAVQNSSCDLLIGPAAMFDLVLMYNRQNINNIFNCAGQIAAGLCVDNTLRFNVFRYDMAFQATLYLPLAGIGVAPDYDMPYYYMYRYGEYGKALHFVTPFNNRALTQQIALILPCGVSRIRVGYTLDYIGNRLGGHTRSIYSGTFTLGCAVRLETKDWNL